jgi:hypothetical protein
MTEREALAWYAEQAEALARYTLEKREAGIEAVMVALTLDAGRRARECVNSGGNHK